MNFPVSPAILSSPKEARPAAPVSAKKNRPDAPTLALLLVVALGMFFRLFHFFDNRSFFIDELFLNINIVKYSFWQLVTEPFAYEQKAPIGYLWASKLLSTLFGNHEPGLRLFSLLCGVAALLLFASVARQLLRPWAAVVAVGILGCSYPLVYHSVEAKQYSAEAFATVAALYLWLRYGRRHTLGAMLAWGVLGGALVWFAFPSIFVLAAIAGCLCLNALLTRNWNRFFLYLIPSALWLLSFALQYLLVVSKYHESGWLTNFFLIKYDAYMPLPPASLADVKWFVVKLYALFEHPLGVLLSLDNDANYHGFKLVFRMGWLPIGLLALGVVALFRTNRLLLAMLLTPLLLTLLASAVRQYPFYQRFTLFLAPLLILLIAFGANALLAAFADRPQTRPWLGVALTLLLLLAPFANSARQVADPDTFYNKEYYREAIFHVNDHYQPGDAVYVFWNMRQGYQYYKPTYGLKYDAILGSFAKNDARNKEEYLQNLLPDFSTIPGHKRLWFVYDINNRDAIGDYVDKPAWYHRKDFMPNEFLGNYFSYFGHKVSHYQQGNYVVELYELDK